MDKECRNCSKSFDGRREQKFCSRSCAIAYRNHQSKHDDVELKCLECDKKFIVSYNERDRKFCSKECYITCYSGRRKGPSTEEHRKNISKAKKGIKTGSRLTPVNVEFWIKKGYTEIESKNKVIEHQKKASRLSNEKRKNKTFEEIYGVEKAYEIKEKIANKLVDNYNNLTIQEKEMLKLKNSESVSRFWNSQTKYVDELKNRFSKNRSKDNKTRQRDFLLNLDDERKKEIKQKKQETWHNHTEEEKLKITRKRIENSQKSIIKNTWGKKLVIEGNEYVVNSSFEEKFILKCFELRIPVKRGPIVKYKYDGKIKYYFIDFEIMKNDKKYLVELKGQHKWYYEELNNGKLAAKNDAAMAYLKKSDYHDFIFILNQVKDYEKILKEL